MKHVFAISYDLKIDTADYAGVIAEMKKIGETCQCLESLWLVSVDDCSVDNIFEAFAKCCKQGDRFFISEVHNSEYNGLTYKKYGVWDWLQKQFNANS